MRTLPTPADEERVRALVASTGFFNREEEDIAAELVREAVQRGAVASGYHFLFLEEGEDLLAYSCFGPIAGTESSFDLFWIATDARAQGRGLGKRVLAASEQAVRRAGGTHVWVETSSREQYHPTRAFYSAQGYTQAAVLEDFYAPGDGKVIYVKAV